MAMVSELDVRARLVETEAQLRALSMELAPLQNQISNGTEGWQQALVALAECYKKRRELEVQRGSLRWVLSQEQEEARASLAN
jgi:hypothetical protein